MSVSSAEDVYLRLLWRICLQLQYELSKGLIEWRHRTGNELIAVQMPYELSNRLTLSKKRVMSHICPTAHQKTSQTSTHTFPAGRVGGWEISSAPHQTVHEVLPHTAFQHSSFYSITSCSSHFL